MALPPIENFEQWIKDNFKSWESTLELGLGVKFLTVTGELFRCAVAGQIIENFWQVIKEQLPIDVQLMSIGDTRPRFYRQS
jgi:hypothetical protein